MLAKAYAALSKLLAPDATDQVLEPAVAHVELVQLAL
jgi:hypothetical protein